MPQRIQRKRTKGWRMPEGAVYVGRPSGWGNPFKPGYVKWMYRHNDGAAVQFAPRDAAEAVEMFREIVSSERVQEKIRADLRGHDLVCWCRLDQPCHADVLLDLANR